MKMNKLKTIPLEGIFRTSERNERLCSTCGRYKDKKCKYIGKIKNPDCIYCSWWEEIKVEVKSIRGYRSLK